MGCECCKIVAPQDYNACKISYEKEITMELIYKNIIVAKIKARIKDIKILQKAGLIKKRDADKKIFLFKNVLSFLNTLEVKEVDLEEEINKEYLKFRHYGGKDNMLIVLNQLQFEDIAKYFFELGLKIKRE